jgi:hypothetical protein
MRRVASAFAVAAAARAKCRVWRLVIGGRAQQSQSLEDELQMAIAHASQITIQVHQSTVGRGKEDTLTSVFRQETPLFEGGGGRGRLQ